jgi:hypothetical protein
MQVGYVLQDGVSTPFARVPNMAESWDITYRHKDDVCIWHQYADQQRSQDAARAAACHR